MADRSIIVRLGANVTGLVNAMGTAASAVGDLAGNLDAVAEHEQEMADLTTQVGIFGLAASGAAAVAVSKFADFDQAMSGVKATGDDATESIEELRQAALDAGADTVFSATEAANGVEALAKAGISAADILGGGLTGALDLAAAGELDVADAAELTATALAQFGLDGGQAAHVADLLAAGANKAQGEVSDMGQALNQSGLVAAQTGLTIEETTGALAAFANAGLVGSDAGTSLKTMLQRLTPQSKEAQEQFDDLGLSAYDAQGEFIGLEAFAGDLREAMKDLTPEARNAAMQVMFGSDAVRAAAVIYEEGESGIREWIGAVDDQGFAAESAATKLDNLKGDLESLGGSFETLMISAGEGADGPLRNFIQMADAVVDKLNEIPDGAKQATLLLVGGAGLVGLGIAGFGKLTLAIAEGRAAMVSLGIISEATSNRMATGFSRMVPVLGLAGVAIAAGAIGFAQWAKNAAEAAALTEEFKSTLDSLGNTTDSTIKGITDDLTSMEFGRSISEKLFGMTSINVTEWANEAGIATADLTGYVVGQADAVDRVNASLQTYWDSFGSDVPTSEENRISKLRDILDSQASSLTKAQKETALAALANEELGVGAESAAGSINTLTAAEQAFADVTEEATKALEDWREMIHTADSSFIDLAGGYDGVIEKTKEWAENQAEKTKSTKDTWEDYYNGLDVSMDEYLIALEEQVAAQQNWEVNMLLLAGRVSQGVLDELAALGPEGAPLVADLVNASDAELARLEDVYGQRSSEATTAFADNLRGAGPVLAALMSAAGSDAVTAAAAALASGETTLQDVIAQYDLDVDLGASTSRAQMVIDMFVSEQSKRQITLNVAANAGGAGLGYVQAKATGGAIRGPGTGTSDDVLMWGSNGEHMLTASDVDKLGGQAGAYRLRDAIQAGTLPAFASGGAVGALPRFAPGGPVAAAVRSHSDVNPQPMWSTSQVTTVAAPIAAPQITINVTGADANEVSMKVMSAVRAEFGDMAVTSR